MESSGFKLKLTFGLWQVRQGDYHLLSVLQLAKSFVLSYFSKSQIKRFGDFANSPKTLN